MGSAFAEVRMLQLQWERSARGTWTKCGSGERERRETEVGRGTVIGVTVIGGCFELEPSVGAHLEMVCTRRELLF